MSDLISLHHDHDTREAKRKRSKVSTKRLQEEEQVDNEEEQLTQKLFGTNTGTSPTVGCDDGELEASAMGSSTVTPRDIPASESHSIKSPWTDSDDCTIDASGDSGRRIKKLRDSRNRDSNWNHTELESRLRKRYKETAHLSSKTQWANVNRESAPHDTDPSLGQVLSLSRATLASNFSRLPSNVLDIVRLKDANESDPSPAVLKSVCFHPESNPDEPLLMTAGLDKTLRFFTVNSSESTKVHGVHCKYSPHHSTLCFQSCSYFCPAVPRMPIYKASFLPASGNVVATGRRSFFYIYDMAHGKVDFVPKVLGRDEKSWEDHYVSMDGKQIAFVGNDGYIVLLDAHHRHVTGQLKINGSVRSIAFHQDGTNIFASGSDGEIYRYVFTLLLRHYYFSYVCTHYFTDLTFVR